MRPMCRIAMAAALVLAASNGTAISQWLVTPPTPPSEWRPIEVPRQPSRDPAAVGQPGPGEPASGDGQSDNDNAARQPNAGCPYQERKLELLV